MTKPDLYALGSLIMMARSDGRLFVHSGSPVVRSYVGVDEVVSLSLWLASRGQSAVFDTGGHVVEIADLAGLVADQHGLDRSSIDRSPATGNQDDIYVGDPTDWLRLTSLAGIEDAPIDELVRETSEWLRHSGSAQVGSQVPHNRCIRGIIVTDELAGQRRRILDDVRSFAVESLTGQAFVAGETPVPVSGKVLDGDDLAALVDSSLDGWLTAGRFTQEFQRKLARYVGARGSVFVNSGSSANLLALSALTSPEARSPPAGGG
jgi:hypothetical protein